MKRKAIQLSSNTLVVSLPSRWAKKTNIVKGSELSVEERGRQLILQPEFQTGSQGRSMSLDISKMNSSFLWNLMNSIYTSGFDEINITFSSPTIKDIKTGEKHPTMHLISRICDTLIGMEIIRQTKGSCIVKQVTAMKSDEIDNLMNRLVMSLKIFASDVYSAAKDYDAPTLKHLATYSEININKLSFYCQRLLNVMGDENYLHSNTRFAAVSFLEQIGDLYSEIAKESAKKRPASLSLLKETNSALDITLHMVLKPSLESFIEFHSMRVNLKRKLSSRNDQIFYRLITILDLQREICTMMISKKFQVSEGF